MQHIDIIRFSSSYLDDWLKTADRKPLLVRGARQVGKSHLIHTWAVGRFGKDSLLEINFEKQPSLAAIFAGDLFIDRIEKELFLSTGFDLKRSNVAVFFDEIQACPRAITALRYFYEERPSLCVLAAGSLLDFVLKEVGIPVGRVESLFIYPLTFAEFLGACGETHLVSELNSMPLDSPLSQNVHDHLLKQLKLYFYVGGMPEAVREYASSGSLAQVGAIHARLLQAYVDDFSKYAESADRSVLKLVFEKGPYLIAETGLKWSIFDPNIRAEKLRKCLSLLEMAGVFNRAMGVSSITLPIKASADLNIFKLLFLDVGLAQASIGFDWRTLDPLDDLTDIYNGRFAEQFVGQEILAARSKHTKYGLHYWYRHERGSDAEIDYIMEQGGDVIPVEVKSGHRGRLKSLAMYNQYYSPKRCMVLSQQNIAHVDNITWLPLYLAGRL